MAKVQFDRQHVLQQSLQLFWQHGFSGSSMQQVFTATGLKPGSVYLAFGNKEALFRETLALYAQQSIQSIKQQLVDADSVELGICRVLLRMLDDGMQQDFCGCFLVKSRLELAKDFPELHQFAGEQLQQIEGFYRQALTPRFAEQAEDYARDLMLHIFGLQVYAYHQIDKQQLRRSLALGLPWLPWEQI